MHFLAVKKGISYTSGKEIVVCGVEYKNFNSNEGWMENSFQSVTIKHHEACRVMATGILRDGFLIHHVGFFPYMPFISECDF